MVRGTVAGIAGLALISSTGLASPPAIWSPELKLAAVRIHAQGCGALLGLKIIAPSLLLTRAELLSIP
jgi:hypothetical protein